MKKFKISTIIFSGLFALGSLCLGAALGLGLAQTANTANSENFTEFTAALPTKLLDINGELITEFSSEEKREIISLNEIPQHMRDALVTREDRIFYEHPGFSMKALFRAVVGQVLHINWGGGSTLTQQIAGTIYCDRTDKTIKRKLWELWWAIQMERRYTKNEILELYLNRIYLGGGTYGVNAASKYYFGHGARQITPAESAILVIQLSNPAHYNPFEHPNTARNMQQYVLESMVSEGYITREEADESFDNYWINFDYTRTDTSAFFMRDDKAPWFSEYVRRELSNMIYGDADIYSSGLTVYTTGNLYHQQIATELMEKQIRNANLDYQNYMSRNSTSALKEYVPLSELLILMFNLNELKMSKQMVLSTTRKVFNEKINPLIDINALIFGINDLKVGIINRANNMTQEKAKANTIEGTMINLENDTGFITALVGGSKFDQSNQFIRAVQARVQPGSSFKPLYYSAALDTKEWTAATQILDAPYKFTSADGTPYLPNNYGGAWRGNVLLWRALALSLNIPALKVLEGVGFDAAIRHSIKMLDVPQKEIPSRGFIAGFPLGLGTLSVKPIEMARSYAVFANGGKAIKPIAIRSVEDRYGNPMLNPEKEVRDMMRHPTQVISPENAFCMTKILENSVSIGTLRFGSQNRSSLIESSAADPYGSKFVYKDKITGESYIMPMSGKTGTTQNWGDAWAIGFSPYYTAAFWFGFDTPGNSMGRQGTGASLAGPPWGDFMKMIHKDLPYKEFPMPETGVVKETVCAASGLLPLQGCGSDTVTLWFIEGTVPTKYCTEHNEVSGEREKNSEQTIETTILSSGIDINDLVEDETLEVNLDFLLDLDDNGSKDKKNKQSQEAVESVLMEEPEEKAFDDFENLLLD